MPMDWRVFGQRLGSGLQRTGANVSQMLLQNYARRLDEKYAKSMIDYQDKLNIDREEREFKRRMAEIDIGTRMDKNLEEHRQNLEDERKVFNNNPQWREFVERATSPDATPEDVNSLTICMSIRERLSRYLPLEKKHFDFLKTLPPGISIDMYAMAHHNEGFLKKLKVEKMQAEAMGLYRGAMADWYRARPDIEKDKASDVLDTKIADKVLNAHKRITDIEKSDEFQRGLNLVESGLSEATMKASGHQKALIRRYKSGKREVERLRKQIEAWEKEKAKISGAPTEEKIYKPKDVPMIVEKDKVDALVEVVREGKKEIWKYKGNGEWDLVREIKE